MNIRENALAAVFTVCLRRLFLAEAWLHQRISGQCVFHALSYSHLYFLLSKRYSFAPWSVRCPVTA